MLGSSRGMAWRRVGRLPVGVAVSQLFGVWPSDGDTYLVSVRPGPADERYMVVLRSHDLTSWTQVFLSPYPGWRPTVWASGTGGIVISGYDEGDFVWALRSDDGLAWELSAGWPGMEHGDVSSVAVGSGGDVITALGQNEAGALVWFRGAPSLWHMP